jgi:hypothetical protein
MITCGQPWVRIRTSSAECKLPAGACPTERTPNGRSRELLSECAIQHRTAVLEVVRTAQHMLPSNPIASPCYLHETCRLFFRVLAHKPGDQSFIEAHCDSS